MLGTTLVSEEERRVDPQLGYPRGYAKLCRNAASQLQGLITPYTDGPPQRFIPYAPQADEIVKLKKLDGLFPMLPEEERDPPNARKYADFLWRQLDHLGNAGFDPAKFRVDVYGNVLYWHADPDSPLAWEVDHWFPHSRGGKTVMSNLRVIQWQTNQRKKNKLEFLVPWWDLQIGISVNQFLRAFASKNVGLRRKWFQLFFASEDEQVDGKSIVAGHVWPAQFKDRKVEVGLAAAAIVPSSRRECDGKLKISSWASRSSKDVSVDASPITGTPARRRWTVEEEEALRRAVQKFGRGSWKEIKENEPALASRSTVQIKDKYRLLRSDWHLDKENATIKGDKEAITMASIQKENKLKQMREEEKKAKEEELAQLEETLDALARENEAEFLALEDLEGVLLKRRQKLEKQRRWAETQSSYRICLERMIRDTMHQSVLYKEQARLNQAACNALMVRLDCQKQTSLTAGTDLAKKYRQREELLSLSCSDLPQQEDMMFIQPVASKDESSCLEGNEDSSSQECLGLEWESLPEVPVIPQSNTSGKSDAKDGEAKEEKSHEKVNIAKDGEASNEKSDEEDIIPGHDEENRMLRFQPLDKTKNRRIVSCRNLKEVVDLVSTMKKIEVSEGAVSKSDGSRFSSPSVGKRSLEEGREILGRSKKEGSRMKKFKKQEARDSDCWSVHESLARQSVDLSKVSNIKKADASSGEQDLVEQDRLDKETKQSKLPAADEAEQVKLDGFRSWQASLERDRLLKPDKVSQVVEWLDAVQPISVNRNPEGVKCQKEAHLNEEEVANKQKQVPNSLLQVGEHAELDAGEDPDLNVNVVIVGFEYGNLGKARTSPQQAGSEIGDKDLADNSVIADQVLLKTGAAILPEDDGWLEEEDPRRKQDECEDHKDVIVVESLVGGDARGLDTEDTCLLDDDEKARQIGKHNLDKWLHVLLHKDAIAPVDDGDQEERVQAHTLDQQLNSFLESRNVEKAEEESSGDKSAGVLVNLFKKLSFQQPEHSKLSTKSCMAVKLEDDQILQQEGTLYDGLPVGKGKNSFSQYDRGNDSVYLSSDHGHDEPQKESGEGGVRGKPSKDVIGGDIVKPGLRASIKACTIAWRKAVKKLETRSVDPSWSLL